MAKRGQKKNDGDWGAWALIVFLFAVGVWPIALVLLLTKLFGSDQEKQKTPTLKQNEQKQALPGAKVKAPSSNRAKSAVRKATKSPAVKKTNAKRLKTAGVVMAVMGLIACWEPIDMMFYLGEIVSYYVEDLLAALALLAGGGAMFCSGISMERSLNRYAKYLAVMDDREAVAVEEIARTLGHTVRQVKKDLEKMIDKGYFGGKAYLNVELGYLFRSGKANETWRLQQAQQPMVSSPEGEYTEYLRKIRCANDAIADETLSAKIDRLEEVTAKIFRVVEGNPQKRNKIDTFLHYYLPTTQKLLDSYAQFESAGVEGENLRQAKTRIESAMDSIVHGFEHQLDELYQTDALDVDSDLRVMETMLRRDTSSVSEDFGLGNAEK